GAAPNARPPRSAGAAARRSRGAASPENRPIRSFALRLELEVLVVEPMPQLLTLGLQVAQVLSVRRHLDRYLLCDPQPVRLETGHLLRIVGEEPDRGHAAIRQAIVAH